MQIIFFVITCFLAVYPYQRGFSPIAAIDKDSGKFSKRKEGLKHLLSKKDWVTLLLWNLF